MRTILLSVVVAAVAGSAWGQAPADAIYVHGNILTGAHLREGDGSATPARVQAMAVGGGKVLAVGTDAEVMRLKGAGTVVVDLKGSFVMPGFNDAHTHMADAGQQKLSIDLDRTPSMAAMMATVKAYAAGHPDGWLVGGGWDHTLWVGKALPSRGDLDAVTGGRPSFLWRTDGHMALANTAALKAARIGRGTADPAGAKIDRDAAGEATGILREDAATALVLKVVPPPDAVTRRKALVVAMDDAVAHGVTSVQDFSTWDDFKVMEGMEKEGALKVRVSEWLDFTLPVKTLEEMRASHPRGDPMLHTGMLKGFMDGSLGSRTAAMKEVYADEAGNSGIPRFDQEKLNAMAAERAKAGFQLGFHAIGDRANAMALDAFAGAEKVAPERETRFRVEHAQVLLAGDFDRFKRLGVIASMQPSHLLTDMNWAGARLGSGREKYAYAWKTFLEKGVVVAFGTDYPVESVSPFRGLYSAVTRMNEGGTQAFHPEMALTISEALYAYTQGSAYAEFEERTKGRLEVGFWADFVVVDRDLTKVGAREVLGAKVLRTVVGGRTVFEGR